MRYVLYNSNRKQKEFNYLVLFIIRLHLPSVLLQFALIEIPMSSINPTLPSSI